MYEDNCLALRSELKEKRLHYSIFQRTKACRISCRPLLFENGLSDNLIVLL